MFWWRSLLICIAWLGIFWLGGHFIPTKAHIKPELPLPQFPLASGEFDVVIDQKQIELDRPVIEENELLALLEKEVGPLKVFRQEDYISFQFGKGLPLYTYLQHSQQILDSLNCPVEDGREVKSHQVLEIEFTCGTQWTGKLRFLQNSKEHQLFSQMAVVFQVDTALDIALLNTLHQVKFPYTLLINPFKMAKGSDYDLKRLSNKEMIIHMPMEPKGYPYVNPGPQTLLINHKKRDIQERIDKAFDILNDAKAVAPLLGDRASQHPQLMIDLFEILADKKASYLDLQKDGRADRRNWCHQVGVDCPLAQIDSKKSKTIDSIERAVGNAKKNGRNILLLKADTATIHTIEKRMDDWTDNGLELVLYSELAATENAP